MCRERLNEFRFGPGHAVDPAEPRGVGCGDCGDDADRRRGDAAQAGDLPEAAHAHLQHEHVDAIGSVEDGHGQALLVVVAALVGGHAAPGTDGRGGEILGRRLSDAAGDAEDDGLEPAGAPRRQVDQRPGGVDDFDRRDAGSPCRSGALRCQRCRGAGTRRVGDEPVTVAIGDQRHEEVATPQRAGVERRSIDLDVIADERSFGRCRDVGCAEPHAPERYPGSVRHPVWREPRPVPLIG